MELTGKTLAEIRRKVGLVFENPDDQLFTQTVEEDVAFGPLNLGLGREPARKRARDVLGRVGLSGFEGRDPSKLSQGEKKRAALAAVLAMEPGVVAFDEPFANVNPGLVESLIDIIAGLDATVIIVSQQVVPLLALCDRVAILWEGKIVRSGSPARIAADRDLLRSVGLDFRSTFDRMRKKGIPIDF